MQIHLGELRPIVVDYQCDPRSKSHGMALAESHHGKGNETIMNKIVAIALLVVGIILLCLAYDSYHSAASDVSRAVTGTSTNKTVWLLIGGIVATGAGLSGTLGGAKKL
jgi:hypothetical protein